MPIVEDFLVNLAAGFAQTLLAALGKRVLGDSQQRALKRAYQVGFEAMLRAAGSGLSQAELSVVGDVIGRFLGQPAIAMALLDLGLVGAPLDVSALAARWNDAGGPADLVNVRFDFGWGLLAFQQSLSAALISEASHPDSPLTNQVTVTRLAALQGQVGQILDLIRAGPAAAPPAGAPLPATTAPAAPTVPPYVGTQPAVPTTLTADRQPSAAEGQPAAAARYHSCFISYASKDQVFADRLYADLRAAGVICWYAPEDMAIGDRIRKTIYAAIGRLDKLLIILSRNSIASEWVEGEIERAFERERRQNETILFPIRLDDDVMETDEAWAGDVRRTRHIGDFTRWNEAEAYARALLRLLRDLLIDNGNQPALPESVVSSLPAPTFRSLPATVGDLIGRAENGALEEVSPDEWDVFISHASEDKETIARPLAKALEAQGLSVWFDEFTLLVGDRLRRSIDRGLANSRYGIVILSPMFFAKEWPQRELDGLVQREERGEKVILPVWHNVAAEQIRAYSLILADRVGVSSRRGLDHVVAELLRAMGNATKAPEHPEHLMVPLEVDMVRVPAGSFLMGSDPAEDHDAQTNEQPQCRVHLDEFSIGKYPITNAQYAVFVENTGQRKPAYWLNGMIPPGEEEYPVVGVSWEEATEFCQWLAEAWGQRVRLPTEAEWEKTARGTDGRLYPWGTQVPDETRCNYNHESGQTTPVGRYPAGASPYGVLDMAGNVWEWTSSLYKPYPYRVDDGREGLGTGERVLRGGAFDGIARNVRCACRYGNRSVYRSKRFGFRIVAYHVVQHSGSSEK